MSYKYRLYIQKAKEGSVVKETIDDFSIFLKDAPFKPFPEAKELYSNDWHDEDGLDEYIPDVLKMASYTIPLEFAYKGPKDSAYGVIKTFIDYLTGRDGSGAEMSFYSTYLGFGRRCVRFVSIDDSAELVRDGVDGDILIFKVTFKVNDPIYDVKAEYTNDKVTMLK